MSQLIINKVKNSIKGCLVRFHDNLGLNGDSNLSLQIYSKDNKGNPGLRILNHYKLLQEIGFYDLYSKSDKVLYGALGFDISCQTEKWVKKFLIKSANDSKLDITKPTYLICNIKNELYSFMYVNTKMEKPVSIDYILETK